MHYLNNYIYIYTHIYFIGNFQTVFTLTNCTQLPLLHYKCLSELLIFRNLVLHFLKLLLVHVKQC